MSAQEEKAPQDALAAASGERRAWPRVPVAHLGGIAVLVPDAPSPCTMMGRVRDVSPGGCCLVVPALLARTLAVGEHGTVTFLARTMGVRQRVTIVAMEAEAEWAGDVRLHLSFGSTDTETQGGSTLWAALTHWTRELRKDPSP